MAAVVLQGTPFADADAGIRKVEIEVMVCRFESEAITSFFCPGVSLDAPGNLVYHSGMLSS
jgi:hypothetical protein